MLRLAFAPIKKWSKIREITYTTTTIWVFKKTCVILTSLGSLLGLFEYSTTNFVFLKSGWPLENRNASLNPLIDSPIYSFRTVSVDLFVFVYSFPLLFNLNPLLLSACRRYSTYISIARINTATIPSMKIEKRNFVWADRARVVGIAIRTQPTTEVLNQTAHCARRHIYSLRSFRRCLKLIVVVATIAAYSLVSLSMPIFFLSFWYCVQFLWDDSQIKCVHIEMLLKKGPPHSLSGSSRTTMWKCVWEHFCLISGRGQCKANSNLIHARIDDVLLRVKCWNMHIKTTNWFYFLQCASGDGYRSTLKKIGFFTTMVKRGLSQ